MLFSRLGHVAWAALLVSMASGSPTPLDLTLGRPQTDLGVRGAMDLASRHLEKRLEADFSLEKSWDNEVLFAGSWVHVDGDLAKGASLAVTCLECYTKGSVKAKLTDKEIINPMVRLEFDAVEAYVDLDIAMSAGATYTVNLFTSNSPIGLGFPGLSVGVVFYVDLVFSLSEEIDLEAGFYVKLADGAYLEASVFGGNIEKHFFDGISSKSLPVTVKSGKATFKADLRLRVQCGAEADIDIFGIGAGAELGIYANLIEFVAVLDSTPTCDLQSLEYWDLNVGAFAHLDVVIDYKTIGAIPTKSTTLLTAPTLTQCWIPLGGSPAETGGATITTTAKTIIPPAASVVVPGPSGGASASDSASLSYDSISQQSTSTFSTFYFPSTTAKPSSSTSLAASSSSLKYPLTNSSAPLGSPSATGTGSGSISDSGDELVTSTVYSTTVYTITSCAASVVNCPASYQQEIVITQTVNAFTTVCPASASVAVPTFTSSPTQSAQSTSLPTPAVVVNIVTDVIVLAPCESPIVDTFIPPSTIVPPAVQQVTATIVASSSSASARVTTSAVPFGAGGEGGVKVQWSNSTSTTSSSKSYGAGSIVGTGQPSASLVQTSTQAAAYTTAVTAGAPGRAVGSSFVGVVGAIIGAVLLF